MRTEVKTNRHWREFLPREAVPPKVLASQFDWTNAAHSEHGDYSDGFIRYKGHWYHSSEFMRADLDGWDGIASDSFYSGVVIKVSSDGERAMLGTLLSFSN